MIDTRTAPATLAPPAPSRASLAIDAIDATKLHGPGAWAAGIDTAGIIHDLVSREGRFGMTTRCGRVLGQEATMHPYLLARQQRTAQGRRWARCVPDLGIIPRGMCQHCARWRAGHEERLSWLVDPLQFDYLRVWEVTTQRRYGQPPWRFTGFELIGWADLGPGARTYGGRYQRRAFYLKPYDRRPGAPGAIYAMGAPCEAVDPRTLAPNASGEKTARVWGVAA